MSFGKNENVLYVGIPSGSLNEQVVRLLEKSGRPVKAGRLYELSTPYDKDVVFRVLDRKEMPAKVAKGIVDCGITGKDYIYEAGMENDVTVIGDFIFAKHTNRPSRLVLATRPETGIEKPEQCAGKTIATELPNLTRRRMKELFGVEDINILHSEGKTEAKVFMGESDVFTDITETGRTLKANGNIVLAELFESNPQLIANAETMKNSVKLEKMEDIRVGIDSVLLAEKEPVYMVFMDVPERALKDVLDIIPAVIAPTVSPVEQKGWISVSAVIKESEMNILAPKLLRMGVDGIVPIPAPKIFSQEMITKKTY
ncbi:MAG: ATP phosphoribosyltransferase [Nitrospinota bacterium]|nr:ATP phosphoribosyltransferase [Nitrospinota bacterium]MDH5755646.1 ATP phosphoribosyltransferase [Nitrospinota bacterium]